MCVLQLFELSIEMFVNEEQKKPQGLFLYLQVCLELTLALRIYSPIKGRADCSNESSINVNGDALSRLSRSLLTSSSLCVRPCPESIDGIFLICSGILLYLLAAIGISTNFNAVCLITKRENFSARKRFDSVSNNS